jgi:cobalt-zinc-cadmium efflux system outer membrane protein
MNMRNFSWIILLLTALSANAQGVDSTRTLNLSYEEAKAILFKENLSLLAAYYDVSAAEADLIQAKLWSNPNLVWNQDLYSVEQNSYFNFKAQRLLQFETVFSIAGKHTNTVKLAKVSLELSKLQLEDVFRGLLFELGDVYYSLHAAQQKQELLTQTLSRYSQLINSAQEKLRVGAMASNEVLRLQSEQIAIKAEATQNKNEVLDLMSQIKIMLNLSADVNVQTIDESLPVVTLQPLYFLMDAAIANRPDFKLNKKQVTYEEQNLKLQRSLATPDMKLGYQPHDKGSNYVRPYQGLVVEINMPLFNRNQGNIKLAQAKISQSQLRSELAENTLRNEVKKSYEQLLNTQQGYNDFSSDFIKQTEELNVNTNENYSKKNINLLEFIDLQRIYIQNKIQFIDLKNAYLKSINQLNFSVGSEILK